MLMVASTRERIDRWLGELLATGIEGETVSICLVHAAVDQGQRTVRTWKLGDALDNCEALVVEIDEAAESDAEGLGGRQRYMLRAYLKGRDVGSLTLRYETTESPQAVDSEPANATGAMALLQRHADGAMRLMVSSFGGVVQSYREQISAQQALIQEYQKQAVETFRLQEALASKRLEKKLILEERRAQIDLTAAREISEIERREMVWKKGVGQVLELAPVILHYLTNGTAGEDPDAWRERQARVASEGMFANVTDADVENWRRAMQPEQFAEMMERLHAYRATRSGAVTEPAPVAPASDGSGKARAAEDLAGMAEHLYQALARQTDGLPMLANAFLAQRDFALLDTKESEVLVAISAALAAVVPDLAAQHLWRALLGTSVAALLPAVGAIRDRVPWAGVRPDVKSQLMRVVRDALRLARERTG